MSNKLVSSGDDPVEQALALARTLHARSIPSVTHPSGARLRLDGNHPEDEAMAASLMRARQINGYASGGAVAHSTNDPVQQALEIVRQHLARGGLAGFGAGLPLSGPVLPSASGPGSRFSLTSPVPVLPPSIAHSLLRHATRQRMHFEDGGDAGGDGNSDGGGNNDGGQNYGGGSNYGGYSANDGSGFGFGGLGGGVSNDASNAASWSGSSSPVGYGGVGDATTTIGRAVSQVGSLSNGSYGGSSYGGSYGASPGGTASDGSYSVGNIGPSGMSTADGFNGGAYGGSSSLGFGSLGAQALGSVAGIGGGLNSAGNGRAGLGWGGDDFSANAMAGMGYRGFTGASNGAIGNLGGFGDASQSNTGFGAFGNLSGLGGFNTDTGAAAANPYGNLGGLSGLSFGSQPSSIAGSLSSTGGMFGRMGNQEASSGFAGSNVQGIDTGFDGTLDGAPISHGPSGISIAGGPSESLGVLGNTLGALGGFDNFSSGDALSPSFVSKAGFSPSQANGWGLGAEFGTFGSTSSDPAVADGAPALTVHGAPGFASGSLTGDDTPSTLTTPEQVRQYALTDLAKNLGADYGAKFGLPSSFSFNDPGAVAAVVKAAMGQESAMNPGAINTSSLAAGLNQMLGTGTWGRNHVGPYSGSAADPGADRESSMLGFLGRQAGVDPASMDPRAVGIDAASQALGDVPGTYNNQAAFGLAQLATNPQYNSALAAVQDPTRSLPSMERSFTDNFEAPQSGINEKAREAAAVSNYALGQQQMAQLGLASPSVSAGVAGLGGAAPDATADTPSAPPSTAYQDAVEQALGIASQSFSPGVMAGYNAGQYSDLSHFDSGAASGEDGLSPSDLASENAKWQGPSTAMRDAASMDAAQTPSTDASSVSAPSPNDPVSAWDAGPSEGLNEAYNANLGVPLGTIAALGYTPDQIDAHYQSYRRGLPNDPVTQALNIAENLHNKTGSFAVSDPTGIDGTNFDGSSLDPASPITNYTISGPPANITPDAPAVTDQPSYLPGQKTALKVVGGILGSAIGGPLGGIAGAAGAGWLTDHSSPGTVSPVGGQEGNGRTPTQDVPAIRLYATPSGGSNTPAIRTAPASYNGDTIATAAYLNALRNLPGPGPAAKNANAVPLVAPRYSTPSLYNPMQDPAVLAALRQAGVV